MQTQTHTDGIRQLNEKVQAKKYVPSAVKLIHTGQKSKMQETQRYGSAMMN